MVCKVIKIVSDDSIKELTRGIPLGSILGRFVFDIQ